MSSPSVSHFTPPALLDLWPASAFASMPSASTTAAEQAPFDRWLNAPPPSSPGRDAAPTSSPRRSESDSASSQSTAPAPVPPEPSDTPPTATAADRPANPEAPADEKPRPPQPPQAADDTTASAASDQPEEEPASKAADPAALALAALANLPPDHTRLPDAPSDQGGAAAPTSEAEPTQPPGTLLPAEASHATPVTPAAVADAAAGSTPQPPASHEHGRASRPALGSAVGSSSGDAQPSGHEAALGMVADAAASATEGQPPHMSDGPLPQMPPTIDPSARPNGQASESASLPVTDNPSAQAPASAADLSATGSALVAVQAPSVPPPTTAPSAPGDGSSPQPEPATSPVNLTASSHSHARGEAAAPISGSERSVAAWSDSPLVTRVARALALAQQRDGEVRLRLSPPELGTLRIELKVHDGMLSAQLQTETEAARTAILDQLPVLRERLAEQGIHLERFDVDLLARQGGSGPNHSGGQPRDWSLPPRAVEPLAKATPAPLPGGAPAGPRTPAGPPGGLDVLV